MAANPEIEKFIRDYASSIGIDADVAVRVAMTEALNVFDPNKPDGGGDGGSSFGPFQLHYGGVNQAMPNGGLGDEFTKATGLDARNPSTWREQVKFALTTAKRDGWRQWMGAANNGIPRWAGIKQGADAAGTEATAVRPPPRHVGGAGSATGNFADDVAVPTPAAAPEPTPAEVTGDVLGETLQSQYNPFGSLGATLANAVSKSDSLLKPQNLDLATAGPLQYRDAAPPPMKPAADPVPQMDLASLFKVAPVGQQMPVDSVTGRPIMRRQYG